MGLSSQRAVIDVRRTRTGGLIVTRATAVAETRLGVQVGSMRGTPWGPQFAATDAAAIVDSSAHVLDRLIDSWAGDVSLTHREGTRVRATLTRPTGSLRPRVSVELCEVTEADDVSTVATDEAQVMTAILDTSSCLSVITDRSGRIQRFSPDAERLTGYSSDDVVGHPVWALVAPEDQDRARAKFDQAECIATMCAAVEDWVSRTGQRRSIAWLHTLLDAESACPRVLMTGVDLTEQRLAHGLFESVLDAATEQSIIATGPGGTITFFNPGAERMTGLRADEVIGLATPVLLHDPVELATRARELGVPDGYDVVLHDVRSGGPADRRDWTYLHRSGRRLTVSLTVSALRDRSGAITGYLTMAEDVTEVRAAHRHLQDALATEQELVARLSALDRAKNDFITSVSHELRTPLTSILGYTDVLMDSCSDGGLSPVQQGMVRRVDRNGRRLLKLIENLLTLADLKAGTFSMERRPVDLVGVVSDAVVRSAQTLKAADLEVTLELGLVPSPVLGDETQLGRVVSSLVDNAVKSTPAGGQLRVGIRQDGGDVVFEVADTGVGISESDQARLFDAFGRTRDAQTRESQGLGLGLAIVGSIVDSHGGRVSLTSTPGVGTAVVVRLPRAVECGSVDPPPVPVERFGDAMATAS